MTESIRHDESPGGGEFYVERGGKRVAEIKYSMRGEDVAATHTFVDPDHRGGTLARDLVAAVVAWARAGNRRVIPVCPYVKKTFEKSPEQYVDVWKQ